MKTKSGILRIIKAAIILVLVLSFQVGFGQFFKTSKVPKKRSQKKTYRCENIGIQKVKHIQGRAKAVKSIVLIKPSTDIMIASIAETKPEIIQNVLQTTEEQLPLTNKTEEKKDSSKQKILRLMPNPVYFRYDSYRLDIIDLTQIAIAVSYAKEGYSIALVGHTDNWGSERYNDVLSDKRANIIRDMMIELGCNPDLISARGEGEKYPATTNEHEKGRQSNRRVEFIISMNVN